MANGMAVIAVMDKAEKERVTAFLSLLPCRLIADQTECEYR